MCCRGLPQANDALHAQLRDLNGVVERVVQSSLGKPAGARPKLPASAFPSQAKPGSRTQRQAAPPPKGAVKQTTPSRAAGPK